MTRALNRSRGSGLVTALVSLAIVFAAIVAVVLVQRHRASGKTAKAGAVSNLANMPGMAMAPGASNGGVSITASQIRELGITFGAAEMRPLVADTRATGVVAFDETRVAQVAPKLNGFVERLDVNATGQPVSRGQPLLDVYSPDLLAAEQELLLADQLQHRFDQTAVPGIPESRTDFVAAARRRLELWDISPAQIDEVLRTGRVRRTFTLYSPASGVVVTKNVLEGQAITVGQALYTIADLANLWIDVDLREADAMVAKVGSRASIEVTGLPGQAFTGRVAYVYPALDTASRAVRARVVVPNENGQLKLGMFATVHLTTGGRSALTVPSSAVLRTGTRNVVFVDLGGGRLMPVEVEVGRVAGELTEVLAGLEPGQRVVTSAQFLLDSESNLADVMRSMISQLPSEPR
jgi:multidrug efflux pump subunit AcrA (membrane-fusion protein)